MTVPSTRGSPAATSRKPSPASKPPRAAGFGPNQIKLNSVLMRGRNEDQLVPLIEHAARQNVLLRFIELMPVSTTDVLTEANFLPVAEARRRIEAHYVELTPAPEFRTNGPAAYYQLPDSAQRTGFIGAMTNLRFCENCNKLRLLVGTTVGGGGVCWT